jgi:hypothetical protein
MLVLASSLAGSAAGGSPVFAVREILDGSGRRTPLSSWISDEVASRLATDSGWIPVERDRLGTLAEEHALASAGATGGAQSSGALLGAHRFVLGTYHEIETGYLVALRVVDATTGSVLSYPKFNLARAPGLDSFPAKGTRAANGPLRLDRCAWEGQVMIHCFGEIEAPTEGRLDIPDHQEPLVLEDGTRVRLSYFTVDGASNDARQLIRARSRAEVSLFIPATRRPESFRKFEIRYRFGGREYRLDGPQDIE